MFSAHAGGVDPRALQAIGPDLLHRAFIRGGGGGSYYYYNPHPHSYVAPYRRYQIPTYTHPRYGLGLAHPSHHYYYA